MRIFIINTYYKNFLDHFYASQPHIEHANYADHHQALINTLFGTSDFYSKNLKALGHEAQEFIINDEKLQKKWAAENGITYRRGYLQSIPKIRSLLKSDWLEKIVEAQIEAFKPDVIYSHDLRVLSPRFIHKIKSGLYVGQIACPLPPEKFLKAHDLILTSLPHFVTHFRSLGIKSEYFRLGFEHTVLDKIKNRDENENKDSRAKHDAVFIGTFGSKHEAGTTLLEKVASEVDLKIWGRGKENLKPESALKKAFQGEAWGKDMYQILHDSKISINRHIDIAEEYANNMRLYESTGVGALLLTDTKKNLGEFFIPGEEIATYEGPDDLVKKIQYYLSHEDERQKIAKQGQERTLREHTYKNRMRELVSILSAHISTAPLTTPSSTQK